MREKIRKLALLFMTITILLPSITLNGGNIAYAEDEVASETGESAAGMTQSMIKFFQEERTSLDVNNTSYDEVLVYGIFLSNFFKPWSTTIGDMVDDSGANALPKQVSKRFFGSDGRSAEVTELNKKLYDAVTNVMGTDKKKFAMYAKSPTDASAPLSGKQFYEKLNGKDKDGKVYGQDGKIYMDLKDPATRASMQILFGIEPDMFVAKDKGLWKITEMYMDGMGNVWGAYDGAAVESYVNIMPAVLNPRVYAVGGSSSFRFPVSNTFVMGANLKMTEELVSSNERTFMTPYYNVPNNSKSSFDKNNLINIYGIYSPTEYIGKSDSIIKSGVSGNLFKSVGENFLSETSETVKSKKNAKIVLSVNGNNVADYVYTRLYDDGYDATSRAEFIRYFTTSSVFNLDQVADEMYYFTNPQVSSEYHVGDSSAGSFTNVEDLITPSELFTIPSENGVKFHSASSTPSPFVVFHKGYKEASNKKSYLGNFGIDTSSEHIDALMKFLDTGTWGVYDEGKIKNAMKLLNNGKNDMIFDMIPPSKGTQEITTDKFVFLASATEVTAPSFTADDKFAMYLSVKPSIIESYKYIETNNPFKVNKSGGTLDNIKASADANKVSAYFHNFMSYRIFGMNSTVSRYLGGTASGSGGFTTPWGGSYNTDTAIMDGANNYAGMYWGLMVSLLGIGPNEDGTGFSDPTPFQNANLPYMEIDVLGGNLNLNDALGTAGLISSEDLTLEEMQRDIVKKVYGILQTGPSEYRDELVKSFQESWVLSTHRSIVGTWTDPLSVSAGSGGSYASTVNFISMPSLADLPLTEWLLVDYLYIYMLLMMIVLILLTMMFITNRRTLSEVVLVGFFLAVVLILPQFLVNNVLQISNKVSDSIYSEKFDYWAIIQHQQSEKSLSSARATGNDLDYIIANSMENAQTAYSTDAGVRVKWMSPKKQDNFKSIFNESTASKNLLENVKIFRWLFNSQLNQEEYVYDDPLATYIYRPYTSIAREAKASYGALAESDVKAREVLDRVLLEQTSMMGVPEYRFKLYKNNGSDVNYPKELEDALKEVQPYLASSEIEGIDNYRYWSLANSEVTNAIFRTEYSTDSGLMAVNNRDDANFNAFLLSTESPFYYFYNVFQTRYSKGNIRFKDSLLKEELFVVRSDNSTINGTKRDFLDMEGLFTYVIPYLHQSNEYVYGWTDLYGRTIEGYNFETGMAPSPEDGETESEKERLTRLADQYTREQDKKAKLENVWMMYTPWVDALYDIPGATGTTGKVAEKRVEIQDAINPGAYDDKGRAMIFSEADMRAKAYRYSDLTDIERRIQAVLDATYEDMLYLVNYYDFDDDVLLTAAAMSATFNFNAEFSSNTLLGEGVTLYPQNYEMKNFNYDAFMRLILLNSTGEPLIDTKGTDLYANILAKTSIFTGIMLIICDIIGVIFIPAMKILAVLLLLMLTLAICLSSVISPPEKIVQTILKQVGLPVLYLLVSNIVFAWAIGVFMGDGLESYVGSQSATLSVTDPTITMVLLVMLDLVYIFILFKIAKLLLDSIKSYFTTLFYGSTELISQVGGKLFSTAKNISKRRTASRRHDEMLDAMKNVGNGTGNIDGGGNGQGGGGGSQGGGGLPPVIAPPSTNGNGSSDRSPQRPSLDVDKLASTPNTGGDDVSRKTASDRVRYAGNKYVDFKVGISKARFKLSEGKDYAMGGGLRSDTGRVMRKGADTVRDAKDSTFNKVREVRDNTVRGAANSYVKSSETMSHIKQYEIDKRNKLNDEIYNSKHASQQTKVKRMSAVNEGFYKVSNSQQAAGARRSKLKTKYNI